ncbi:uncharacterized protein [Petaurus breviceps papuanus]|uniref:uncharacterized protein n=1 Tax=Petaurus breviceps papuanus TaxID=3040969 RepID=UPI0036DC5F5B
MAMLLLGSLRNWRASGQREEKGISGKDLSSVEKPASGSGHGDQGQPVSTLTAGTQALHSIPSALLNGMAGLSTQEAHSLPVANNVLLTRKLLKALQAHTDRPQPYLRLSLSLQSHASLTAQWRTRGYCACSESPIHAPRSAGGGARREDQPKLSESRAEDPPAPRPEEKEMVGEVPGELTLGAPAEPRRAACSDLPSCREPNRPGPGEAATELGSSCLPPHPTLQSWKPPLCGAAVQSPPVRGARCVPRQPLTAASPGKALGKASKAVVTWRVPCFNTWPALQIRPGLSLASVSDLC